MTGKEKGDCLIIEVPTWAGLTVPLSTIKGG